MLTIERPETYAVARDPKRYRLLKESAELMPNAILVECTTHIQYGHRAGAEYHVEKDSMHLLKGRTGGSFFYTSGVVEDQPEWFVRVGRDKGAWDSWEKETLEESAEGLEE